jgi:steroid 5-alpha reductase family enzyme
MFLWDVYLAGLVVILGIAFLTWLGSLRTRDVSIVDSVWSLFFLAAAAVYAALVPERGPRAALALALVAVWAVRLAAYLTTRNWGEPEDRRYQAIRRHHEPGFAVKSLYLIFGLQGLLAWVISLPLLGAIAAPRPLNQLDAVAVTLWLFGFVFETVADLQLARFKRRPESRGRALDTGLWRYTRHPNYFGEFCLWWGIYLLAAAGGAWWSVAAPLLLSFLLLRVSGVALLERDITERRPAYRQYIERTNAFFPGPPRGPRMREVVS